MGNHRAARMRRHRFITTAIAFGLLIALSNPAFAGGPADKATGSGTWINGQGLDFYAEFDAHAEQDG